MTAAPPTIRVVIPLKVRRRNGRPRIMSPADIDQSIDERAVDSRTLRAIARAWDWRRRLERGDASTLKDIADQEGVTVPFISRFIRLSYLSPAVLERILIHRRPCAVPLDKLAAIAVKAWADQPSAVFEDR